MTRILRVFSLLYVACPFEEKFSHLRLSDVKSPASRVFAVNENGRKDKAREGDQTRAAAGLSAAGRTGFSL